MLAAELGANMKRRRARRAELAATPVIAPALYRRALPHGEVLASGTPGSQDAVAGRACIIRTDAEFGKLRPGDVPIAHR